MPDVTFLDSVRAKMTEFAEKAVGVVGIDITRQPRTFTEVHEKSTELLLAAEQDRVFGIDAKNSGIDDKDLSLMLNMMGKLDEVASSGEVVDENSPLSLIPENVKIVKGGEKGNLLVEILGEKIQTKDKEITLQEALRLAKEADQATHRKGNEWKEKKDKTAWELINKEDRQRIAGIRKTLEAVGLDPDSLAVGNLGVKIFEFLDKKTGKPLVADKGDRVVRFEPAIKYALIDPNTDRLFLLQEDDSLGKKYAGQKREGWRDGDYVTVNRKGKVIILRLESQVVAKEAIAVTVKGQRIETEIREVTQSVFPKSDEVQEIPLRQLLINLSRKKQGDLADAYLTTLQRKGQRIGWNELGENRGMVIEGMGFGSEQYKILMRALQTSDHYEKWRAIATLSEHNDRFQMFFGARNRDEAQKSLEGGSLSRLASADNIAAWIGQIPDMAATLDWQEWQGFEHPKTGEPIDYPAVRFDVGVSQTLQERQAKGLIKTIIQSNGEEVKAEDLANYQGRQGDIFVLRLAKTEHKSMALINVLKERARYLGVETYIADLAFAFHRVMFTGQDKGISYNKAMTVSDYWQVADIAGMGEQVKENYAHLTKEEKAEFEKVITQTSIFQTGVSSFFYMVFGMRDQNALNRDRAFRQAWKDRAPVYGGGPPEWVQQRIGWANSVNWEVESTRRGIYRWMGDFTYSIGKGLKDVAGKFSGAETPFNWQNQHHMRVLVDHLLSSPEAAAELTRVGLDQTTLTRPVVENLIKQIFADNKLPEAGGNNFLGELKKFDDFLGYERAANAKAIDFANIDPNFQNAVRLEKALESTRIFGNLLEFTGTDGWSANQALIDQIKGAGGMINDGSYDRMVHNMLYWYKNYLTIFDNFIKMRLGKEPAAVENIGRESLAQWQDQAQQDVRGTPVAFLLHWLNELNDESIRSDIRDKQLSHVQLNKLHEEHRLWRDAVLFYGEPELDPEKYEAKIEEYGQQRMLKLHREIDIAFIELLRKKAVGLKDVAGLVDPDGNVQLFKWAVQVDGGKLVGPGEAGGRDSAEYLKAYTEEVASFYYLASELDLAGWLYNLDMTSTWTPEVEVQTVSKDGQGMFKYDILKLWYGVVENDVELYHQLLGWYKQLRDLPREDWGKMEKGEYAQIPEILVGMAREYLVYENGQPMNLRADDNEAAAARSFFRQWLYYEDVGGYQPGYVEVRNSETKQVEKVGTPTFNKSFQVLIALMLSKDINANGVPENPNDSRAPRIDIMRYFLYLNTLKSLISKSDDPNVVSEKVGFYDQLMRQRRVGKETRREFFEKHNVGYMAEKERIVEQMASLIRRDKMFSPNYNMYGEVLQRWFGLSTNPDDPSFSMAGEVQKKLENLVNTKALNEVKEIMTHLNEQITEGKYDKKVFVATDIQAISKFLAKEHGIRILPRGYWFTGLFRKISFREIERILQEKLPLERQARRWVYMNYGIDIGDQANMNAVYQEINQKVPHKWRSEEGSKENSYLKALADARKQFKGTGIFRFWFGKPWLDETFFNKPHYEATKQNLDSLNERIVLLPAENYLGVLRQSKVTAHKSMYFYKMKLIAGQLAMSDAEKFKMYEEMRNDIPPGKYNWELLELSSDELFGFARRPLDFNTDLTLTMEYAPMPLISLITSLLSSWGPFKGLQGLDKTIKMYVDASWGSLPLVAVGVGLPIAAFTAGALTGGPALIIGLVGYEAANILGRLIWAGVNKSLDKAKIIERHPRLAYLLKKGIIK